ncbi:MAG: hypothetical protein WD492_12730 [Alkalispirochaeta sp.]
MKGYNHGEAYCLMWYASNDGKTRERIWNSRDGVTPFTITAADSQTPLRHVDWNLDECVPDYVPPIGSRVFVDLTYERSLEQAREYVSDCLSEMKSRYKHIRKLYEGMTDEQVAQQTAKEWVDDHGGGNPDVIVVTEDWLSTRGKR